MGIRRFHLARERVLVLGDSHAVVFGHWRFRFHLPRTRFERHIVGGATVSGLDNPNSKTQANATFAAALASSSPTAVVLLLGEVDTGFVIWYRAEKRGQPVDAMLEVAVDNYERLLRAAAEKAPVIVISAPLPTIRDGQDWGEVANARKEVQASLVRRTELTLRFNRMLQQAAQRSDATMLSLDDLCLGPGGLVAPWLLNPNPLDHHYSTAAYAKLLAPRISFALSTLHRCKLERSHQDPHPVTFAER